ncbi:glyoxylate/hydroxypyruvate reductase A [Methylobacterium phyllostachyos]|uniref:Glyoxylate/hydroxypyruvate reductase A n=1 Tax=Methylobacterium phyllostachyos TaxID=582672 RepID=A0A1G9R556_9HYPH|nr:glyoxylate/hydroxypyruvate reductase A [Methylobacterium phyllostachyos]SDM18368.1 glyoxylate/hydroxypyruvate reductase A [Methylobacterium phyllostachyos]
MVEAVALIGCKSPAQEAEYLRILSEAMPEERIVPFRALDDAARAAARIAIVANPDPAEVAALPGLVWVQSLWAGVEKLVGAFDRPLPIVRLVDREMARTMAEAVLAWTYYLQRDMPAYARQQRERVWRAHPYRKPADVTVGLLGLGALGTAAAQRLVEAGFNVVGWSRTPRDAAGIETVHGPEGLPVMLGRSDVVVCLVPLTAQTRGLMNAERLSALKAGAALINFARGPIVVTDDLIAALDSGHLSHAVLDVFEIEPLPSDSPLWSHPGVTVLPHISGPTDMDSAAATVAANVRAYRRTGQVPEGIDAGRGY